ncbi:threonine kinase [Rhodovulum sp. ES.010]|uniref:hypothetical protein n=1 Tax=Rhodovulum sp. ES.010 TaxID=1882821 RepID=UPI00092B3FD4|nr:hypothetical protein [Rhodovulum sp. ES.010]SIO32723.1 threonine kinase [Rhodovulum sp. ES.010]
MRHSPVLPPPDALRRARVTGHFGELLQGRLGPTGTVALVTLPCPALAVSAHWAPANGFGLWQGARPVLTRGQVRAVFDALGAGPPRGRLRLRAEMPPGGGAGASTAALLATMRCLAGGALPADAEAALCLSQEGATDPLMLAQPGCALWAPRMARILGHLPPLPALEVVGGFAGPGRRTDPADTRFADISDLVEAWGRAGARETLAALATESARRNHALRGGPDLAPLMEAARQLGALGVAVAHTGTAQALLFTPGAVPADAAGTLRALGLSAIARFRTGGMG